MENNIQVFNYENTPIEFDLSTKNLMINATEMAKLFGKSTRHFLVNEQTKEFIKVCLYKRYSAYLGIENQNELFVSKPKTGTWMHRILAIKFAAWLSPEFEFWIIKTIDELVNCKSHKLNEINTLVTETETRIFHFEEKHKNEMPEFAQYLEDKRAIQKLKRDRHKVVNGLQGGDLTALQTVKRQVRRYMNFTNEKQRQLYINYQEKHIQMVGFKYTFR